MTPGPLRRLIGCVGLVALVPTAWLLAIEAVTLVDAALRAGATLLVVVVVGRLIGWVLQGLAGAVERDGEEGSDGAAGHQDASGPRRSAQNQATATRELTSR